MNHSATKGSKQANESEFFRVVAKFAVLNSDDEKIANYEIWNDDQTARIDRKINDDASVLPLGVQHIMEASTVLVALDAWTFAKLRKLQVKCVHAPHFLDPTCLDWTSLRGAKRIIILHDGNDESEARAEQIWCTLQTELSDSDLRVWRCANDLENVSDWISDMADITMPSNWWYRDCEISKENRQNLKRTLLRSIRQDAADPVKWAFKYGSGGPRYMIPLSSAERPRVDYPVNAIRSDSPRTRSDLSKLAHVIAELYQVDNALVAHEILATLTLVLQHHADIKVDSRTIILANYYNTIATSGERKSAINDLLMEPVRQWQNAKQVVYRQQLRKFNAEQRRYDTLLNLKSTKTDPSKLKKLIENFAPPEPPLCPIVVTKEPTVKGIQYLLQKGQPWGGLYSNEGSQLIGGYSWAKDHINHTAGFLNAMWDMGECEISARGELLPEILPGIRFSANVMMTPNFLSKWSNNPELSACGFTARWLAHQPVERSGKRIYGTTQQKPIQETVEYQTWCERIREFLEINERLKERRVLTLSRGALSVYADFENEKEQRIANGDFADIKPFANKAPNHMLRIAGLLELYYNVNAERLERDTLESAERLINFYLYEQRRIKDVGSNSEKTQQLKDLLRWLLKRTYPMTLRQIAQDYTRQPFKSSVTEVKKALEQFVLNGYGRLEESPKKNGRDSSMNFYLDETVPPLYWSEVLGQQLVDL
jgi:hypothetical protein